MDILAVIGWILFGLIVGLIARLLIPGRDPMGWIATMVLGIMGSLVGGLIAYALQLGADRYSPAGWILSVIGGVAALLIYYWATGTRRGT